MESTTVKPNKMKRMESKKSHSWWWNSHVSPKNSKWLQENLEEMDQRVKQMLKLIEEDADSFSKKAEMYYQKRPELISLVEDFYRRYRSLAERYDHVTGELRKNLPQDLQSQSSGISEIGSEPPSTMTSPDRKPSFRKSGHRAPGFEVFLGNAGANGSDLYNKDGDESSTLDSESESDDSFANNHSGNDEEQGLHRKIIELEDELREVKKKLQMREEEISADSFRHNGDGNSQGHDKMAKYEEEIKCLKIKLQKYKSLGGSDDLLPGGVLSHDEPVVLDSGIDALEAKDSVHKIQTLKEELRITQEKLHESEEEVAGLREELTTKGLLIQNLQDQLKSAQEELSIWKNKLEKELGEVGIFGSEIQHLKDEIADKNKCMEELRKNLEALQQKYDMVVAEKDDLKTSISELSQDVSFKDDQIDQMSNHLHQLHKEHVDLIAGAEGARKLAEELHLRIKELEREVERKQEIIVQGAEEKREAIRQLCFSLEHYRNGYHRLREVVTGQKPVMAT